MSEILFPFFLQVMWGVGSPVATQRKAAIPPARTIWSRGASRMTGGSEKQTKKQFINIFSHKFSISICFSFAAHWQMTSEIKKVIVVVIDYVVVVVDLAFFFTFHHWIDFDVHLFLAWLLSLVVPYRWVVYLHQLSCKIRNEIVICLMFFFYFWSSHHFQLSLLKWGGS